MKMCSAWTSARTHRTQQRREGPSRGSRRRGRERSSRPSRDRRGGDEEGEGGGRPTEEAASDGGREAAADTAAPASGRKKKKKRRAKTGGGAAGGGGEEGQKANKNEGAQPVANWFHKKRKRKKGSDVHRVLNKVNLYYTAGSSILGKKEARAFSRGQGSSPVRCRVRKDKILTRADKYCRVARQATRFVATDRVLDLLPGDDTAKGGRRRCGSCALVGNSGVLLQRDLGEQIDKHDQVFRFKLALTEGYEKHVGSWSSHEILNPENIRKMVAEPEKLAMLQRQGPKITVLTFDNYLQFTAKLLMKKKLRRSSREDGMHSQLLVEKHMEALADFHDAAPDVRIEYISPEFLAWSYEMYAAFERAFASTSWASSRGNGPCRASTPSSSSSTTARRSTCTASRPGSAGTPPHTSTSTSSSPGGACTPSASSRKSWKCLRRSTSASPSTGSRRRRRPF